jgi:hypothetical protein
VGTLAASTGGLSEDELMGILSADDHLLDDVFQYVLPLAVTPLALARTLCSPYTSSLHVQCGSTSLMCWRCGSSFLNTLICLCVSCPAYWG